MGRLKLYLLLLLLSAQAFAQQGNDSGEDQSPSCLLASRYKNFKKYTYQYEAEVQNGVTGTAKTKNGPKVACTVELEVPQSCSFVLRTLECSVSEVSFIDAEGQPMYQPTATSDTFKAAMEKNPLKFSVGQDLSVSLFPESQEPANILNVKRGIVSALIVPTPEQYGNVNMPTIHGRCKTSISINPSDVTLSRDLTACKGFAPMADYTSPLALVSGMSTHLSKLISSSQSCSYQFDNKRKHMTATTCTEKHIFLPFSHKDEYGITSHVKQTLTYRKSDKINNRNFDYETANERALNMEYAEDKSPTQSKDSMLDTLRELKGLSQTQQGQQRAALFQKLVSQLRGLSNDTLGPAVAEMMEVSKVLTWQALPQCGTPECISAILQDLRSFGMGALEVDAVAYAVGFLPRPDARRVTDMLSMAQNRQTKAVMYGLSNTVRRFYDQNGVVTPEVMQVSEFMTSMLSGDCTGDKDRTFLTLRVIGNMGAVMDAASPDLKSTILRCAQESAASPAIQQAAIQALRQMKVDEEASFSLGQIFKDAGNPVQKRIAAYLIMMKNPELALPRVDDVLKTEQDQEVTSFVVSHIANMLNGENSKIDYLRTQFQDILDMVPVYQDRSHNYKMETPSQMPFQASVESNMIYDSNGYLPREVMLDTTLKAFGYNLDMFEVGLEGKGLEPTIDALFGEDGFFPDSASKTMYWVGDKMPDRMHDVLKDWIGPLRNERMRRQVSRDLVRDISKSFHKLMRNLKDQDTPEALAYLRIFGTELGYIKASEIEQMAYVVAMYGEILFKLLPADLLKSLLSSNENDAFAHYIFMDNEFALPTGVGLPLKFALSGISAGGAKGGLSFSPGMKALSFMPSLGVALVTKMGVDLPEFVTAGIEMHTYAYHESALNAKVTMEGNSFKLSIPAPQGSTQLFSIGNKVLSVSTTQTEVVPPLVEDRTDTVGCDPLFAGLKLCSIVQYSNASTNEAAPSYPLTGESKFALEIQPTGDVSEYTATVSYTVAREGKEGSRQKVDTVKLALKAEGTSSEATATLKYNRNKGTFSADMKIPDHDMEVGIQLTSSDSNMKGKRMRALNFDVTNKNIPQLSLVGRARMEAMKEAVLQIQLVVPSLDIDAATTATMKNADGLTLQLETSVNVPETSSVQKAILKYDENRVELEVKSDLSSGITKLFPETEVYRKRLQKIIDDVLDQRVARTDMKLRHIVSKAIEAVNIWLEKASGESDRSKRSIPELTLPSVPEKLYLNYDGSFRYQFNKNKLTLTIPLLLGGKTSKDLNLPTSITIPEVYLPEIGWEVPSRSLSLPTFTIPRDVKLALPLMGVAELSAKVNSNFYDWEGSISGGNDTVDVPSFIGKYKVVAESPINFLSYKVEGAGMLTSSKDDTLKYLVNGSFSHSLLDAGFSIMDTSSWGDQFTGRNHRKIEVSSPLGLKMSLYSSAQSQTDSMKGKGEFNLDGAFKARSLYLNFNYTFSNFVSATDPYTCQSTLKVDSSLLQAQNRIDGVLDSDVLSVISNTNLNDDAVKHEAELTVKNAKLSLKSRILSKIIRNQVELAISGKEAAISVQTDAEIGENHGTYLITGTLDAIGLKITSDGSIKLDSGQGFHKASLDINRDGVATDGTTTLKCSPLTFENTFHGSIDMLGFDLTFNSEGTLMENSADLKINSKIAREEAYLNSEYKGNLLDLSTRGTTSLKADKQGLTFTNNHLGSVQNMRSENTQTLKITLWTLAFQSNTDNYICDHTSYKHEIKVDLIPFVATVSATNDLKLLDVKFNNVGSLKLEPSRMHLKGSLQGAYNDETELKHTYDMNYADLAGGVKCSTSGKLLGVQMSHNSDFAFAGLSSKYDSEARLNSKSFRLTGSLRTLAEPFSLSVDAVLNSDGEIDLNGKLTGQLNSKFLLKAQPLAVAYTHNCRASATHKLDSGASSETNIDNKIEGLLSPQEQSTKWTLNFKLNDHVYNQEATAVNQAERVLLEFSGALFTDILNKAGLACDASDKNQEFWLSGFLKYDKNGDSLIIQLPFIESFPALFEKVKNNILNILESLQAYMNSADINQLVGQFRENLDKLPRTVGDYMKDVNLENKFKKAKENLIAFTQDYAISLDDLEISVENMKTAFEETLNHLLGKIRDLAILIKDKIESGAWSDALADVLNKIGNEFQAFNEKYEVTKTIVSAIGGIEDIITQIDLQKLKDNSMAWLQDLDTKFQIKEKLLDKIGELKQVIESFDISMFIRDLRDYITSINVVEHLDRLSNIPTDEISRVIDSIKDVIVNWIEEYEVADKINAVSFKLKELITKYGMEKRIEALIDQALQLIKRYKLQETVQVAVNTVKSIDFQSISDKFMQLLEDSINRLKAIDFKQMLNDLNEYIAHIAQKLKEFDYDPFVDDANQKISDIIQYVNDQIEANEIPQKIEASREFLRSILTTISNYLEQLKNTKVAEVFKIIKDVIDTTVLNDIKKKIQESLDDMRQRVSDMDISDEVSHYLERARDSYINMISYIGSQISNLIQEIERLLGDQEILKKIGEVSEGVLNALKMAEFSIPSFTVPFTDLVVPDIPIQVESLHMTTIPPQVTIPEFTILGEYVVPSITIDFEELKQRVIAFIERIKDFEMPMPDPEDIFGDLRVLYLSDFPDLALPEITLKEIKFPGFQIPKLNLENFEITMPELTMPIPELKLPEIPGEFMIPAFGKLYGEFRINSPCFDHITSVILKNSTSSPRDPEFLAALNSEVKSVLEYLEYTLDATARLAAPNMKSLDLIGTMKFNHKAFSLDHQGTVKLSGPSAQVTATTTAKANTEKYKADIVNNVQITLVSGITANIDTTYNHDLNIPSLDASCQASVTQKSVTRLESGTISMTVGTTGNGKWSIQDYSDEGTYKSDLEFTINLNTAKLTFSGDADSKAVKMKHNFKAQSVAFSHITFEANAETETPFIRRSVIDLNGKGIFEDLKVELTASHDTEFVGIVNGAMSNSIKLWAHPFEFVVDSKNKGNLRVVFPLKLTGKIDLQDDFGVTLNSQVQKANWVLLARFNQYKYSHNFKVDNNKQNVGIYAAMNGEANLDFLTVPLTIPEMNVPYSDMKTPNIKSFSLWEDTGLNNILSTTRQSFDIDFKLAYQKNPDSYIIGLELEPIYASINENAKVLNANFELARDKAFSLLTKSYNHAKAQFEKFRIDAISQPPRIFTVPGYTVPILNIEVSPFTAEMPAFSFLIPKEVSTPSFRVPVMGFSVPSYTLVLPAMTLPVLHVPETLQDLTLPTFTLPTSQDTIMIPAMGNITYDFSLKCSVITLNINAGLFNQQDIVARFAASSTSAFDILNGKLDATTSLSRKRALKLATALSVDHKNIEGRHDSIISLRISKRSLDAHASVATTAKLKLPMLHLDFSQELTGDNDRAPNVASKIKLKYSFDLPLIEVTANGNIDQNLVLEQLPSSISLETTTKGKIDGTVKAHINFVGALDNEANVYLNANGIRSSVKTDANSKLDYKKGKVWDVDMKKILAIEASLRRVYMTLSYTTNNMVTIGSIDTNGRHTARATLEFIPLTTLTAKVETAVSQRSSIGDVSMNQTIDFEMNPEKQKFTWTGKTQVMSLLHQGKMVLSNDDTEVRLEMSDKFEGNVAFLKTVELPVYQKTVWDVLKFDQVTAEDQPQSLTFSTMVVYTKNMEGLQFALPARIFENGVTFSVPEITFQVPFWIKDIAQSIREIDMRFENTKIQDEVSVPPAITIPSIPVPFTDLMLPSFTLDPKNLNIPKVISTPRFTVALSGLPGLHVPSVDIETEFHAENMPFLLLKITFPTITILADTIEVPKLSLYLPTGVFIPYFGALSTTVEVQSPIYSNSWNMKLENQDSSLVSSLKSICKSTVKLLEYSLEATATTRIEDGTLRLKGSSSFDHDDLKVEWKHTFADNIRAKRQATSDESSLHTLDLDIISKTFIDVHFRYASRKDGLSASISSPSSGFVGLVLQKRSPSQVNAKLLARYASAPDKDVEILSFKASLKNSEKLALQAGWNLSPQYDMLIELRKRVPAITDALLKFANKHHNAHFGMDLDRASLKLKNTLSNTIERAYHEIPRSLETLQANLKDQGKAMYKRATNDLFVDLQELIGKLLDETRDVLRQYRKNIKVNLDAAINFLSETKFQLPGFQDKLTGQELYHRVSSSIAAAVYQTKQRMAEILELARDYLVDLVDGIEFTVPALETKIRAIDILLWVDAEMTAIQDSITQWVENVKNVRLDEILQKLSNLLQTLIQRAEQLVSSLKIQDIDELSDRFRDVYTELRKPLHGVISRLEDARQSTSEYKDQAKMKIQEVYNQVTRDRVNNALKDCVELINDHSNSINNEIIDFLQQAFKGAQPYVRVSKEKMNIDVPLPFFWKSFNEWPTQTQY